MCSVCRDRLVRQAVADQADDLALARRERRAVAQRVLRRHRCDAPKQRHRRPPVSRRARRSTAASIASSNWASDASRETRPETPASAHETTSSSASRTASATIPIDGHASRIPRAAPYTVRKLEVEQGHVRRGHEPFELLPRSPQRARAADDAEARIAPQRVDDPVPVKADAHEDEDLDHGPQQHVPGIHGEIHPPSPVGCSRGVYAASRPDCQPRPLSLVRVNRVATLCSCTAMYSYTSVAFGLRRRGRELV